VSPSGREAGPNQIRIQLPGYAWLDALRSSFIADNESWWERREYPREKVVYIAIVDAEQALMIAHALEGQSKVTMGHQSRWALHRAVLRIEADIKVLGQPGPTWST